MKKIAFFTLSCFLILTIALLVLYRGAVFQRRNPFQDEDTIIAANDDNDGYKVYELEGLVLLYPSHWVIDAGNQDGHILFYETKPDPNPTGGPTYFTQLYCWAVPLDLQSHFPKTAQERLDYNASTMSSPFIEHEILDLGEAEAAKTTYARPDKPIFHHTQIYIYYKDMEYCFSFFCDTTNENDIDIVQTMINSIVIK